MENNNWSYDKREVRFSPIIEADNYEYDIVVLIRHATFYPFDHLHIQFTMDTPREERRSKGHIIPIKDENGKFLGKGLGDIWDLEYVVKERVIFTESGEYTFFLDNLMKKYNTPGIMEIGIDIRKSKKN